MSAQAGRVSARANGHSRRRVRLPADRRTPAAARAIIRSVLAETDLNELLNEALLLTTELSTNAVMHAGTELVVEVMADASGLTVLVTDFAPVSANGLRLGGESGQPDISDMSERGRGLLLVDHFASRWGTTHLPDGKGVWFRLDRKDPATDTPSDRFRPDASTGRDTTPALGTGTITELIRAAPDPYAEDPLPEFAADLLARVAGATGATGGVVWLDHGDGAGPRPLARYGRPHRPGGEPLRVPLSVNWPYAGELELDAAPSDYTRPLAALVAERLSLHLENDRLRRTDVRRRAWLTFLAEAGELLAQSLDVELTLALIPQLVVPRLGQWCAVHTIDDWGHPRLAAVSHADESMLARLHDVLDASGPESVRERLREAARSGSQVPLDPPMEGLAVPLIAREQRLGILAVGRPEQHLHDPDEIGVVEDVARRAALAIDNARIHDERRRVARNLQRSLLPPVLPAVAGIGFAAEYVPAGDAAQVGGDFYDLLPLPDGRWLVAVGDVSGKGVQAATVTGLVRDVIRVLVADGKPIPETLFRLNHILAERGGGRYCTLALAAVRPGADGRLDVALYLAGHDRPALLRADGQASFVGTGGTALGLLDSITAPSVDLHLGPGDTLVFYTDGVTERRRGQELFGTERLRETVAELAGYPAEVIAARLRSAAIGFSPESPRDDIAILVLRNDSPA